MNANRNGMQTHKQCVKCKEWKHVRDFNENAAQRDGLQVFCRPCHNAAGRRFYRRMKLRAARAKR